MATRRYSMTVRAERAAQTRERILDAALGCYRENGISATSLQAIARRANVSAATVLNHFGSADALARLVIERLAAELALPDDREWPEAGPRDRIRRFTREMFEFYERSRPWFEIFRAEMDVDPALVAGQAEYWTELGDLSNRVFGEALARPRMRAALAGLTNPGTFTNLRDSGLSVADAAEIVADTLIRLSEEHPER
ncbi:TetR/AcrR family transcriptional regulator [Agromyces sp. M3QZ16-3]|uniref:TetR/AcrR family transcriptional regulator n=1 Tax=Agromyces sp. M3QZ16-3 TaxID=3447585 RepID=UPI003F68D55F